MSYLRPNSCKQQFKDGIHTNRPASSRPLTGISRASENQHQETATINPQRREKLKNLLFEKFKKKYGRILPDKEAKNELEHFMNTSVLTEKALKELDKRIESIVVDLQNKNYLSQNLNPNPYNTRGYDKTGKDVKGGVKEGSNLSNYSRSKQGDIGYQENDNQSQASKKSQTNKNFYKQKPKLDDDDDRNSLYSHEKAISRMEFDQKGEWNAIAEFNKQDFINQIQQDKIKDKELKNKTKKELNNQILESKLRKMNERSSDLKYGDVVNKTVELLTKVEMDKLKVERDKIKLEKRIRDEQLLQNKARNKKEFKNQREFELSLLLRVKKEAEEEKRKEQAKVIKRHEELIETLKENEVNKKIAQERLERERQEDINSQLEYAKLLDKQEKARADYFKDRERKGNTFISLMVENVIKDQEQRNKKLDDAIKKHADLKDLQ